MPAIVDFIKKNRVWFIVGVVLVIIAISVASVTRISGQPKGGVTSVEYYGGAAGMAAPSVVSIRTGSIMGAPIMADMAEKANFYPTPQPTAGATAAEVDQKIIKNGYLQVVVDYVGENISKITGLATGYGGFVQQSSVSERADGTHYGEITIRVPAKSFETAMAEVKKFAKVVKSESANGQDVTEQYTDLEAQLHNAQAQEATYLEVLKKANTVEDILKVQERLGSIRGVIESLQGRIKYLENQTSYSTISVNLEEEPVVKLPTKEFRPWTTVKMAVQALIEVVQVAAIFLINLIIIGGGILLPIGLIAWAIWAIYRHRRSRK